MPLAATIALEALLIAVAIGVGVAIGCGLSRRSPNEDLPGGAPYDPPGGKG